MGIANIINNSTTTSGGEIVRELVNSSDGAGLHFDGAAGNIDIASPPDLGTKFSFEFVVKADSWSSSAARHLVDFGNGGRFAFAGQSTTLQIYDSQWRDFGVAVLDDLKVHHLVVTIDGTAATLYDNGNQVATATLGSSSDIDSCSDAAIGSYYNDSTLTNFNGTIYRARFYNKALEPDEVQTAYERADVPFADQYGSASNAITNGNFETNTSGWTSENTSTFQRNTTSPISGTGDLEWTGDGSGYPGAISNSFSLTAGKKYRIKFTYRVTSGTVYLKFGKTAAAASAAVAGISEVSLTASSNTAYEATVTPTESTTAYIVFRGNNNTTPTMFVDLVDFVQIGCVSDYQTQWANPTQSLTVQDASGNADGTCSSSGVSQVQKVVQGNLTSLAVSSGTARTPADGAIISDTLGVGVAPVNKLSVEGYNTSTTVGTDVDVHIEGGGAANRLTQLGFGYNAQNASWKPPVIIGSKTGSASGQTEADFFVATRSGTTGTDAPTTRLTIDGSGNVTVDGGGYVKIGPADTQAELRLYRDDATINAAGIAIGDINFGGADANNDNAARLRVKSDAAWTASSSPTAFEFQTCPSGSESLATRLVIDSDGLCTFSNGITVSGGILALTDSSGGALPVLTISSGAITITSSVHQVEVESGTTDDLTTINGGTVGAIVMLRSQTNGKTVVVKDQASGGNFLLNGDFSMASNHDTITLLKTGTYWQEISRSDNA